MADHTPFVRLDSFGGRGGLHSWQFGGYAGTLQTYCSAEVPQLLNAVEQAATDGMYAVGYIAYEAGHPLNPDLPAAELTSGLPLAWFALYRTRISCRAGEGLPVVAGGIDLPVPAVTKERYLAAAARVKEYISAGDCYQANLTFPLQGHTAEAPLALYHRIGLGQQAPFGAFIDTGQHTILSASPELFFSLKDGSVTTRPMKGTAQRGRWHKEDLDAIELLRNSPKDRAENLMIVDLLRNDLGMVAETGTVRVDEMFAVESYPTVHQLTSTVSARLRSNVRIADLFRALFPCGSITGAPKRRTMEIIRELEQHERGVYCGAIGYLAPGREALFSVAIRTILLEASSGTYTLGVGSGITWDSDPEQEYAECLAKGAFMNHPTTDFRLLESLRYEAGGYSLLERHLHRLASSAAYFGFHFSEQNIRNALAESAPVHSGASKVRLTVDRYGEIAVYSEKLPSEPTDRVLTIAVADECLSTSDSFRYHKTTQRGDFERARQKHPGCDEVIFLNERGEVTEGSYHTIVLRLNGNFVTPPLTSGVLPGTLREELIAAGSLAEQVITAVDLGMADELWLINSVRGWRRGELVGQKSSGEIQC